jgi:hypothetical protein
MKAGPLLRPVRRSGCAAYAIRLGKGRLLSASDGILWRRAWAALRPNVAGTTPTEAKWRTARRTGSWPNLKLQEPKLHLHPEIHPQLASYDISLISQPAGRHLTYWKLEPDAESFSRSMRESCEYGTGLIGLFRFFAILLVSILVPYYALLTRK